jgi:hypothetical protein
VPINEIAMPRLTADDWAQIRYAYEHTAQPIDEICATYAISSGTLRDRLRRWGWRRRRPPIPREGPPAFLAVEETRASSTDDARADSGDGTVLSAAGPATLPVAAQGDRAAVSAVDDRTGNEMAAIVPALHSAVARVIPAIEQTIAQLASGEFYSDQMERTARALGALTRTLRELNALLSQQHQRRW